MITAVREIRFDELHQLLELYQHLNPEDPELIIDDTIKKIWNEIIADSNHFCLVLTITGF